MDDLASRLAACPEWRWAEGMRDADGRLVVEVDSDGVPCSWVEGYRMVLAYGTPGWAADQWRTAAPSLSHDATAGCLLAMLWVADPMSLWSVERHARHVVVFDSPEHAAQRCFEAPSLGEACAAALVAIGRCA